MEFLGIPLFDNDVYKLVVRLVFNLAFVSLIVGLCYYPHQKDKRYVFTFMMMNVMVFFICFTLKKLELGLGMALGLFAIFAIIRYRTNAMRVKEMTYLFIVIGIAVINALSNRKSSYTELVFANVAVLSITWLLEQYCITVQLPRQDIVYDNLELLKPERREALLDDIRKRTGLNAISVKINKLDLQKGLATLSVKHSPEPPQP